ncbi:Ku protein [Pusillimonas sp. TS35]|uniref:non-homologous end joining protein Ku n=1 Tax=Paracandidimonas lactea TaxID=2895524 RepID=UPI00136BDB16|nr:Ku protein [Paracandidimonas lactea]MYN13445.1 Ku protein [Pusillimonas sp. TS35]
MASISKRALWKGAISFGLVHIPIALHPATENQRIDFDWLDRRTMEPVGYKRINKASGKEISRDDIVKGIEYENGEYVILSQDEIAAAYPKTTQTVEIETFVPIGEIPFVYLDRPYYVSPTGRGAKVYALLREVLRSTGKVGIAKVVIQTKQHLALLMPCGPALILNLLRWGDEVRTWEGLGLPAEGSKSTGLTAKEMAMGEQLIKDMSGKWDPNAFTDSFKEQVLQLVKHKVEAGETHLVAEPETPEPAKGAKILDLTEMLQRSLGKRASSGDDAGGAKRRTAPEKNTKAYAQKSASSSTRGQKKASKTAASTAATKTKAKVKEGAARRKAATRSSRAA